MRARRVMAGVLLTVEGVTAAALALVGLLVNGLWVSAPNVDVATYPWWTEAGKSLAGSLVPVGVFALIAWIANRWVVASVFGWSPRRLRNVTLILVGVAASGSVLGALAFGVSKPHM